MTRSATPALHGLNHAPDPGVEARLAEVCASSTWVRLVREARPWADTEALHAANHAAMSVLTAADLDQAMAGHARIGTPRDGDATSQREQAGVRGADRALLDELHAANASYEEKFGHVFLICATGRTAESMLSALRKRQPNDADTEREIVRRELTKINDIRLNLLAEQGN